MKNHSFSVTAEVVVAAGKPANGVIIAQGGRFGGWSLHSKDGLAKSTYNVLGIHEFATLATEPIAEGKHQVRAEFAYDGGGLGKGGNVTLYYGSFPLFATGATSTCRISRVSFPEPFGPFTC